MTEEKREYLSKDELEIIEKSEDHITNIVTAGFVLGASLSIGSRKIFYHRQLFTPKRVLQDASFAMVGFLAGFYSFGLAYFDMEVSILKKDLVTRSNS